MNLYEITWEVLEILHLQDEDWNLLPEHLERLEELKISYTDKFSNIGKYIRNLEADFNAYKQAEVEFKEKKKSVEKKILSLKTYAKNSMLATNRPEVKTEYFTFNFRKSESVEIINEDKITNNFYDIIETKKIDKTAIKKAIKEWAVVEWAELNLNQNLQIK